MKNNIIIILIFFAVYGILELLDKFTMWLAIREENKASAKRNKKAHQE